MPPADSEACRNPGLPFYIGLNAAHANRGAGGAAGVGKIDLPATVGRAGLSSDAIRGLLVDDETDQTIHDRVFQTLRYLLRQRLALGRPLTYIDATNLTAQERAPYVGIGKSYGAEVEALFFDVPLEVCLERNRQRSRMVPEDALVRLAAETGAPRPPTKGSTG